MTDIQIYPSGTPVIIHGINNKGFIYSVSISNGMTLYEVRYFVGHKQETAWLDEIEFMADAYATKINIGFKTA